MVQQRPAQKASLARPKRRCEAARLEGKGEIMRFLVVAAGALIAAADPAFDLTRRIGFRAGSHKFSELRAAIGITLSDGDGVRQVCAAACRIR